MQTSGDNRQVRPPVLPSTEETARQKVKAAQDAWNTRDPKRVSMAYTEDLKWRNRDEGGQWWRGHTYERIATPCRRPSPGGSGPGLVEAVAP